MCAILCVVVCACFVSCGFLLLLVVALLLSDPAYTFTTDPGVYRLYSQRGPNLGGRGGRPNFATGQVVMDAHAGNIAPLTDYGFTAGGCLVGGVIPKTPGVLTDCFSLHSAAPGYANWYLRLSGNSLLIAPLPASTDASYAQFKSAASFKVGASNSGGFAIEQLVSSTERTRVETTDDR